MSHGLDLEHQRRLRAERVLDTLRLLWGEDPPPGPDPHLTALIDAVAADDAHGAEDRLVCQGDGVDVRTVAALWRHYLRTTGTGGRTDPSPAHATGPTPVVALPPALLERLQRSGLLDETGPVVTSPRPVLATGGPPDIDEGVGVWHLDAATGTVVYDALGAQLIGAGTAGHDRVQNHLETLVHPEDRDAIARDLEHSLRTGQDYRRRFRVVSAEGVVTWLFSHGRVVHAPAAVPGAPTGSPQLVGLIRPDRDGAHGAEPRSWAPPCPIMSG